MYLIEDNFRNVFEIVVSIFLLHPKQSYDLKSIFYGFYVKKKKKKMRTSGKVEKGRVTSRSFPSHFRIPLLASCREVV